MDAGVSVSLQTGYISALLCSIMCFPLEHTCVPYSTVGGFREISNQPFPEHGAHENSYAVAPMTVAIEEQR